MRYSDAFGGKTSKIFLGTAYFGDGICEKESFEIIEEIIKPDWKCPLMSH